MANPVQRLQYRWQTLPIRVRGTLIITIPVTCLFTALSAFAWLKASLVEDETWVQHTQVVRLETKLLLNALIDAETGVRGYGLTQQCPSRYSGFIRALRGTGSRQSSPERSHPRYSHLS